MNSIYANPVSILGARKLQNIGTFLAHSVYFCHFLTHKEFFMPRAVTAVSAGFVIEGEKAKLVLRAEESFRTNLFSARFVSAIIIDNTNEHG